MSHFWIFQKGLKLVFNYLIQGWVGLKKQQEHGMKMCKEPYQSNRWMFSFVHDFSCNSHNHLTEHFNHHFWLKSFRRWFTKHWKCLFPQIEKLFLFKTKVKWHPVCEHPIVYRIVDSFRHETFQWYVIKYRRGLSNSPCPWDFLYC